MSNFEYNNLSNIPTVGNCNSTSYLTSPTVNSINFYEGFLNLLIEGDLLYEGKNSMNQSTLPKYFIFRKKAMEAYTNLLHRGRAISPINGKEITLTEDQFIYINKFRSHKEFLNALRYQISDIPLCPYCGQPRSFRSRASKTSESIPHYNETCSNPDRVCWTKYIDDTCNKKYGCRRASSLQVLKDKTADTCNKKYGTKAPAQNEFIKNKMYTTWESKYGVKQYFKSDDFKNKSRETCLKHWGVDHTGKSAEIRSKIKETMIKNYGVDNPSQVKEFQNKKSKRYLYKDLYFDSSMELELFIYCEDNNLNFIFKPDPLIYQHNGGNHRYFPDFIINGRYVEVKGDILLDENNHLIPHPTDCKTLDACQLEELKSLLKSKEECMKANNVYIFKEKSEEHLKIKNYIHNRYGSKYITSFKKKK